MIQNTRKRPWRQITPFHVFVTFQGCVGNPLPGTEVRIVAQNTDGKREVILQEQSQCIIYDIYVSHAL